MKQPSGVRTEVVINEGRSSVKDKVGKLCLVRGPGSDKGTHRRSLSLPERHEQTMGGMKSFSKPDYRRNIKSHEAF